MVLNTLFKKGRLASVFIVLALAGCQSTQQAPIDSRPEGPAQQEGQYPTSPGYPDGSYPGSQYPDGTYPGQPEPEVEMPKPAPRPTEPTTDAAVHGIEADAERYMSEQQWQKSIELAEQGLRIDRRNAEFYRILGESYRQLGDIPQARRFAKQAQRFCQKNCESTDNLLNSLSLD